MLLTIYITHYFHLVCNYKSVISELQLNDGNICQITYIREIFLTPNLIQLIQILTSNSVHLSVMFSSYSTTLNSDSAAQ